MGKRELVSLIAAAFILTTASTVAAMTYYVDAGHSSATDDNVGSETAPWRTIQHAVSNVGAGDVVIVRPGIYDERITVSRSGTQEQPIILKSESSRQARVKGFVLNADYISIEGFEITADEANASGIYAGEPHNAQLPVRRGCRMIDNFIHDVDGKGIVTGVEALVKGNLLRNVGYGMMVYDRSLVEGNEIDGLIVKILEIDNKPRRAKYMFFNGDDITFRNNYLHGVPKDKVAQMGVCCFGSYDFREWRPSKRILIENNRCFVATHASEPIGTVRNDSSHITYRNNLFVDTTYVGVMPKGYTHVTIENNTFINCGTFPIWLQGDEQTQTAVVRNNLIAYYNHRPDPATPPPTSGVRIDSSATADCDHNLFFGTGDRGYGQHNIIADPKFVDPDNGDFRLTPDSPAVDVGTVIDAIKTDLNGIARPQGKGYDIGAYEVEEAINHKVSP